MKPIIHPGKQKFIIVLVAALAALFGFESAGLAFAANQAAAFFKIAFYVYIFLVIWQMFVFDLNLKKSLPELVKRFWYLAEKQHWIHFQNYLILPAAVYWAMVVVIYLNPFDFRQNQIWAIFSTLALAISFWYLKTVFYAHKENPGLPRDLIFAAKLYASFLAFAAALGAVRYFDLGRDDGWLFALAAFCVTFVLMYQALFQHHYVGFGQLRYLLLAAAGIGLAGYFLYYLWNVNYFSGALVLAAGYNTIWGIIHHKYLDRDLRREIVYEYLAVLFVILVIVFGTTNFAEKI